MSLTLKFALFTSCLCFFIIGGIVYLSYLIAFDDLETSLGQRLEAIVRSGAVEIDGSAHDLIKTSADAESETFIEMRDYLRRLKEANDLDTDIYTLRRVGEKMEFVVMTNEKPFIGDEYSIRASMLPTLSKGEPARTGVYTDAHGQWISAYAPIFDQQGNISGLLEADFEIATLLELLRAKFYTLLLKAMGFALFAIFASYLMARTVTSKLKYLTEVTEKISLGKMEQEITIKGNDEVSRLGASLERMRESLLIAARYLED